MCRNSPLLWDWDNSVQFEYNFTYFYEQNNSIPTLNFLKKAFALKLQKIFWKGKLFSKIFWKRKLNFCWFSLEFRRMKIFWWFSFEIQIEQFLLKNIFILTFQLFLYWKIIYSNLLNYFGNTFKTGLESLHLMIRCVFYNLFVFQRFLFG